MRKHGGLTLWQRLHVAVHAWMERMRLRAYGTNHRGIQEGEPVLAPVLPEFATPLSESLMVPLTRGTLTLIDMDADPDEPAVVYQQTTEDNPVSEWETFTVGWRKGQLQEEIAQHDPLYDPDVPWWIAQAEATVELDDEPEPAQRKARKRPKVDAEAEVES